MKWESVPCCDDCWWGDWSNPEENGRGRPEEAAHVVARNLEKEEE